MPLLAHQSALRILTGVLRVQGCLDDVRSGDFGLLSRAVFQGQVVSDSKEPPLQVRPGLAAPQVLVQRDKGVLNDVFCIAEPDAERTHVAEQRISGLIESSQDLRLDAGVDYGAERGK
jgi:hypothetical protein